MKCGTYNEKFETIPVVATQTCELYSLKPHTSVAEENNFRLINVDFPRLASFPSKSGTRMRSLTCPAIYRFELEDTGDSKLKLPMGSCLH